jgi:hypothetical protein
VACFFTLLICMTPSMYAGDQSSGLDLLQQAERLADIRAEGSPPFHMRAVVQFSNTGVPVIKGDYDLKWRSRSSWREEIHLDNFWQVRIAEGEKLWEVRNIPYFTPSVQQLQKITDFPQRTQLFGAEHTGKIVSKELNGVALRCVEVKAQGIRIKQVCLRSDSVRPVRVEYSADTGGGGYEYSEFAPFGLHEFPRVIREFGKGPTADLLIQELTEVNAPDPGWFVPPPGARWRRWCPNPEPPQSLRSMLPSPPEMANGARGAHAVVYGVIGTDGMWHDLATVESSGRVPESAWFNILRQGRFRPAKCGGTPIETEMITEFGNR